MLSVNGYYDGHNYITEGNIAVKPNQRVIITFLDKDFEEEKPKQDAQEKLAKMKSLEELHHIFGTMTHEEAEDIRNNRVNFKECF